MSITAIAWAFKVEAPSSTAKFVLVKLADNANDAGICWPSVEHLAKHTQLTTRAVREQIRKLEEVGLLSTEHRKTEGVNLPNIYHLRIEQYSSVRNKVQEGTEYGAGGVRNHIQEGTEPRSAKPSIEPSKRTVIEPVVVADATPRVKMKATRWPSEQVVSEDWRQEAGMKRAEHGLGQIDVDLEAEKFANFWASKSGQNGTKVDWHKTWINWALKAERPRNGNGKASPHDNFAAGAYLAASGRDRTQ